MKRKEGWISLPVDDEVVAYAKKIREDRDKLYGNIYEEVDTDMRHVGEIGEFCFDHFVNSYGTGLNRWLVDGKVTNEADFIFAGKRIGIKTVKRNVDMRLSYDAQITAKHSSEPVDYYFFCCYETHKSNLIMLGGIEKSRFFDEATYYPEGSKVHANYTIRKNHEIYNIGVAKLMRPEDFVGTILRGYSDERRKRRSTALAQTVLGEEQISELSKA
jgi:hypothetical protein